MVSIIQIHGVDSQVWEVPDERMKAVITILNTVGVRTYDRIPPTHPKTFDEHFEDDNE